RTERALVIDEFNAVHRAGDIIDGAEVAFDQFDFVGDMIEIITRTVGEIVENADVFALVYKSRGDMRANESCPASDENSHIYLLTAILICSATYSISSPGISV